MAVYCGVCAIRITSASDNYGDFSVNAFDGWDVPYKDGVPSGRNRIQDTCLNCASTLRAAVTLAAQRLRQKHQLQVDVLRVEMKTMYESEEKMKKEKREFEAAWVKKKEGL